MAKHKITDAAISNMIIRQPVVNAKIRKKIVKDTKDFLKNGGSIEYIPLGTTGINPKSKAHRQLRLSHKDARANGPLNEIKDA